MYVSDCISILMIGFLLGSIPSGVLLAKAFKLPDPRTLGSGNIGATNMLRTGRKDVAALTLLLDGGKGIFAVLAARYAFPDMIADPESTCALLDGTKTACIVAVANPRYLALALLGCVVGHCYSPWLKGRGGKGFATLIAGSFAVYWPIGASMAAAWLICFWATRYSSLSAFAALSALIYGGFHWLEGHAALITLITGLIVVARHHQNIRNLFHGTESRFGGRP